MKVPITNVQKRLVHGNTAITERRFDLHNEEEGTENKAMETRHRSYTGTLLA